MKIVLPKREPGNGRLVPRGGYYFGTGLSEVLLELGKSDDLQGIYAGSIDR
jgi:hypothetical protein